MRPYQIESWALNIIDRVEAGQPHEDSRVELKAAWPSDSDIPKVARQIAGHANAARGDPILWLIGVDQKTGVTGADHAEVANWYPRVQAQFDGLAPQLTDINVPIKNTTVVALLFTTDRAPFVVKNPVFGSAGSGPVEREVPWREGTSTRSARRDELIRLLSPLQLLPDIEIRGGHFEVAGRDKENKLIFHLQLELYVVPRSERRIVIPFHRCETSFEIIACTAKILFDEVQLRHPFWGGFMDIEARSQSLTIQSTISEVLIDGPGVVNLEASVTVSPSPTIDGCGGLNAQITATLLPVDAEIPISISATMRPMRPEEAERDVQGGVRDIKNRWKLDK